MPVERLPKSHRSELNRRPLGLRSSSPDANGGRDNDLAAPAEQFRPEETANGAPQTVPEVSAVDKFKKDTGIDPEWMYETNALLAAMALVKAGRTGKDTARNLQHVAADLTRMAGHVTAAATALLAAEVTP